MDSFKVAEAYIEFKTKGDPKAEVQKAKDAYKEEQEFSKETNARIEAFEKDRLARGQALFAENLKKRIDGENKLADLIRRHEAKKKAEAEEKETTKSNKGREEEYWKQVEASNMAKRKEADRDRKTQQVSDILSLGAQTQKLNTIISQIGQAGGSLPGVRTAANVAHQGVQGYQAAKAGSIASGATASEAAGAGAAGAVSGVVIAGLVQGVRLGIEGAFKASPQVKEKLDYQADRLQAGFGQLFLPALEAAAEGLRKFNDNFGIPALNNPKISDFASIRDRLQTQALAGMAPSGARATNQPGFFQKAFDQILNTVGFGDETTVTPIWNRWGGDRSEMNSLK